MKGARPTRGIRTMRVLVVVDATDASRRALQYVARILAKRDAVECHLAYISARLPARLLETGGSERPEREEQIESALRLRQRRWIAASDRRAERILGPARTLLERAGLERSNIHVCVSSPLDARRTADEVLLLARDAECETVVVGHRAHTWFRSLGGGHLAEQLVRTAKGLTVWVVD